MQGQRADYEWVKLQTKLPLRQANAAAGWVYVRKENLLLLLGPESNSG